MNGEPRPGEVDDYLVYIAEAWAAIAEVAAEWETWDEESQMVYRFEWAIPRGRWADLERWAAEGRLTPDQQHQFRTIEILMRANEAMLARMLDTPTSTEPAIATARATES